MTLRALLEKYLEARRLFLSACREQYNDETDFDETDAARFMEKADAAEEALRAALQKAHGLDPRYTTPRPIASIVDGYLITLAPDPNGSAIPQRDRRAFPGGWMDSDVFAVVEPSDVLTESKKAGRRADDGRDGK